MRIKRGEKVVEDGRGKERVRHGGEEGTCSTTEIGTGESSECGNGCDEKKTEAGVGFWRAVIRGMGLERRFRRWNRDSGTAIEILLGCLWRHDRQRRSRRGPRRSQRRDLWTGEDGLHEGDEAPPPGLDGKERGGGWRAQSQRGGEGWTPAPPLHPLLSLPEEKNPKGGGV